MTDVPFLVYLLFCGAAIVSGGVGCYLWREFRTRSAPRRR